MIVRLKQQMTDIQNVALKNLRHDVFALLLENILF